MDNMNMNNQNEFNVSSDNSFKKSYSKPVHSAGFGKTVFVPFLSGIVGATLVVGACFGIPSIKQKLVGTSHYITSTSASSSSSENTLVNIADYSNTSIYVAEKVLPSVVATTAFTIPSLVGSSGPLFSLA